MSLPFGRRLDRDDFDSPRCSCVFNFRSRRQWQQAQVQDPCMKVALADRQNAASCFALRPVQCGATACCTAAAARPFHNLQARKHGAKQEKSRGSGICITGKFDFAPARIYDSAVRLCKSHIRPGTGWPWRPLQRQGQSRVYSTRHRPPRAHAAQCHVPIQFRLPGRPT